MTGFNWKALSKVFLIKLIGGTIVGVAITIAFDLGMYLLGIPNARAQNAASIPHTVVLFIATSLVNFFCGFLLASWVTHRPVFHAILLTVFNAGLEAYFIPRLTAPAQPSWFLPAALTVNVIFILGAWSRSRFHDIGLRNTTKIPSSPIAPP